MVPCDENVRESLERCVNLSVLWCRVLFGVWFGLRNTFMGLITLRRALASDADAIAKLWHASWHAGHGSVRGVQQCLLDDRSLAQFEEQTPKLLQAGEHIVAESADCSMAGKLAGFVSVDATEVTQIFVEPEEFGKGVGGTLLAAAEDTIAMSSSVVTEGTGIRLPCMRLRRTSARVGSMPNTDGRRRTCWTQRLRLPSDDQAPSIRLCSCIRGGRCDFKSCWPCEQVDPARCANPKG